MPEQALFVLSIFTVSQLALSIAYGMLFHWDKLWAKFFVLMLGGAVYFLLRPWLEFSQGFRVIYYALEALAITIPGLWWFFTISVFHVTTRIRPWQYSIVVFYSVIAMIGVVISHEFPGTLEQFSSGMQHFCFYLIPQVIKLSLFLHSLFIVVIYWQDDLAEQRRRMRVYYTIAVSLLGLLIILSEIWVQGQISGFIQLLTVLIILFISFSGNIAAIYGKPFFFEDPVNRSDHKQSRSTTLGNDLMPEWITSVMRQERIYREHGLTINSLANKLSVPAYLLRRCINLKLGYNNFNQFLNEYRVQDAANQLVDAECNHPILTIALETGFKSLSSFNLAFKEKYGMTPSAFRNKNPVKP